MSCVANLRQEQAIHKAMTFNEEMSQLAEKSDPQSSPLRRVVGLGYSRQAEQDEPRGVSSRTGDCGRAYGGDSAPSVDSQELHANSQFG